MTRLQLGSSQLTVDYDSIIDMRYDPEEWRIIFHYHLNEHHIGVEIFIYQRQLSHAEILNYVKLFILMLSSIDLSNKQDGRHIANVILIYSPSIRQDLAIISQYLLIIRNTSFLTHDSFQLISCVVQGHDQSDVNATDRCNLDVDLIPASIWCCHSSSPSIDCPFNETTRIAIV